MAATLFNIKGFILQPGTRVTKDENDITVTERTYIGPSSLSHDFVRGSSYNFGSSREVIYTIEEEILEGGLKQIRVTTKDILSVDNQSSSSTTVEYSRQYFSTVVPGYGYFMALGRWIMVPAVTTRCTRYTSGGYSSGSVGRGGVGAGTYKITRHIRVKDTAQDPISPGKLAQVEVTISPTGWFCASATCTTTGNLQEIEERWEVNYEVTYEVGDDYHI